MVAQKPGASVMPPLSPRRAAAAVAAGAAIAAPEIPPITVAARRKLSARDSGGESVMMFSLDGVRAMTKRQVSLRLAGLCKDRVGKWAASVTERAKPRYYLPLCGVKTNFSPEIVA